MAEREALEPLLENEDARRQRQKQQQEPNSTPGRKKSRRVGIVEPLPVSRSSDVNFQPEGADQPPNLSPPLSPSSADKPFRRSISVYVAGDRQEEERQRLMAGVKSVDIYTRRWYILAMAALLAMLEGCIWNTWGPIAAPAQLVFQWSEADIALLANWGCIAYCVTAFPLSWVMDAKGLRPAVVIAALFITAGAGLRCVSMDHPEANWYINAGHILNGLSSPVTFGAPPLVSAIWFAPEQRTLATSIGTIASYTGIALSFVIGPVVVPEQNTNTTTGQNGSNSSFHDLNDYSFDYLDANSNGTSQYLEDTKRRIQWLLRGEAIVAGTLLILVVLYFPSKPPLPPSLSSSGSRLEFVAGLKRLLTKKVFWVITLIYGLTSGIYSGWSAVLNLILAHFGISQSHAGWIGFFSTVAGAVGGMLVAGIADRFGGKLRQILIVLFMASTVFFSWFAVTGIDKVSIFESDMLKKVSFYMSSIIGGFFINSTIPLFFEMAVEAAFPISEGIAAVIIMLSNNIFSIVLLFALQIHGIGISWTTWSLVGSCALSIPILAVLKDRYVRSSLDAAATAAAVSVQARSPKPSDAGGRQPRSSRDESATLRRSMTMAAGSLRRDRIPS
ncbi:solute carrier family 49 member 4 homolog [Sycon ciliatum]|uniref:solute carrier family 49 member 4 homolog n=1 Tax=Sycon ciliatum TaxID=27933 RepID=UPI0031F701EE